MLARFLRRGLFLELVLVGALAAWMIGRGLHPAAAIPLALSLPFLSRFLGTVTALAMGRWWGSPLRAGEALGAAGAARLALREYAAVLRFNMLDMPFDRWRMRPDPQPVPLARPAVMLLHGWCCNRGALRPLLRRLERAGMGPVFAPNLCALAAPIEPYVDGLAAEIARVAAGTGQPVVLVAHSMGGLAARAYLARHGSRHVAALVTIASPHHGSRMAAFGHGENARQMRIGSGFLAALEAVEREKPPRLPVLSVYTIHDSLVVPQETSVLPWARNVRIAGHGHLDIVGAEALWAVLHTELAPLLA